MALTERLAIVLETVGTSSVVRDFEKVSGATKGLGDKALGASKSLKGLAGSAPELTGLLQGAVVGAAAAAGTALVAFGVDAVNTWYELGQQVLAFQRASGATAEQSSALIAAFDDVGISAETGSKAIFQLGKRLEENSAKLATFGVSAAKSADGNTDLAGTLKNVADAYTQTADPAKRAELLTAAFGRTGQELIPILERGREGIDAMFASAANTGQIFTEEDIQKVKDYQAAMDNLDDAMREVSLNTGKSLVPALANVANSFSSILNKLNDIGQTKVWNRLEAPIGGLISPVLGLSAAAQKLFGIFDSGDTSPAKLERQMKEAREAADEDAQALDQLERALQKTEQADETLATSTRGLADARKDLSKLQKEGAVDEEKVADAVRSHDSAVRSLNASQRDQSRAQEDYNAALADFQRFGSDDAADKLADAKDKLADANDSVANAQDREKDTAAELAKAKAGDPEFNDKLAAAKQKVADAEGKVSEATLGSIEAHDAAADALEGHAAQAQALLTKYEGLIARAPVVAAALQPLIGLLNQATAVATPSPGGPPGGLLTGPSLGNLSPLVPATAGTTTNNTFNITAPDTIDPMNLARSIIWNLN